MSTICHSCRQMNKISSGAQGRHPGIAFHQVCTLGTVLGSNRHICTLGRKSIRSKITHNLEPVSEGQLCLNHRTFAANHCSCYLDSVSMCEILKIFSTTSVSIKCVSPMQCEAVFSSSDRSK